MNSNIGVLNGEPSGWLVDVDLDHSIALEIADDYLPATDSEFGRDSSPRSHRLYIVNGAVDTLQRRLPKVEGKAKMIVELRSTGSQTILPGSVHPEGERIEWETDGEPACVEPDVLVAAVNAIADEVEKRLGITGEPNRVQSHTNGANWPHSPHANTVNRARKYLAEVPPAVSGQGGHDQTFRAACILVQGFALDRAPALELLQEWNQACQPPWANHELEHKIDDARKADGKRGHLLNGSTGDAAARSDTKPKNETKSKLRGKIKIDTSNKDLSVTTPLAWLALQQANNPPTLIRHGGLPTRIEHGDIGEPLVRPLDMHRMRHHLARAADWVEWRGIGDNSVEKPAAPPKDVVNDVLATPDPVLPILTRIVEAPVFSPAGTLQTAPGYHPCGRVFYAPARGFEVPDVPKQPTGLDIESARDVLCDELLSDFPFVSDSEKSHAIALLLLPFARDLIDGPTPLHLIEKTTPGTGATLMVDVIATPAIGRPLPTLTEGRDEDEWRKRITAKLSSGLPHVFIDNLRGRLDSAAVASAITSPTWEDRILGASAVIKIPVRVIWIASGNNPALSSEISRRTIRIRLDARQDRPWMRTGFRHTDLRSWANEHRGLIVWAALTLIRAWLVAGRPPGSQSLGMFERWAKTLGGILQVAEIPGFLGNVNEFYDESDAEGQVWRDFMAAWWDRHADAEVRVADLLAIAIGEASLPLGDRGEQSQRITLGKMLAAKRDRVFDIDIDGQPTPLVVKRGKTVKRATLWGLQIG